MRRELAQFRKCAVEAVFTVCLGVHLALLAVTNHAGHVVSGELSSVTNGHFVIAGRCYPLSVLPASEQRRVKAAAGMDVRTPREKQIDAALAYELKRIDARLAEGEITAEQAAALRRHQHAAAAFRRSH